MAAGRIMASDRYPMDLVSIDCCIVWEARQDNKSYRNVYGNAHTVLDQDSGDVIIKNLHCVDADVEVTFMDPELNTTAKSQSLGSIKTSIYQQKTEVLKFLFYQPLVKCYVDVHKTIFY